jgi:hypothetical protein
LGFEQGETPESMQPIADIVLRVAYFLMFSCHSFNADLASFGPFFGLIWLPKDGNNRNPEFLSKSLNAEQFGQFSSAGPTGPVSSESRKNPIKSHTVVTQLQIFHQQFFAKIFSCSAAFSLCPHL